MKAKLLLLASMIAACSAQASIVIYYDIANGDGVIYGSDSGAGIGIVPNQVYYWQFANATQQAEIQSFFDAITGFTADLNGTGTTIDGGATLPTDRAGVALTDETAGPLTIPLQAFAVTPGWSAGLGTFVAAPAGGAAENIIFNAIPEPSTYLAIASAVSLLGFVGYRRFRAKKAQAEEQAS